MKLSISLTTAIVLTSTAGLVAAADDPPTKTGYTPKPEPKQPCPTTLVVTAPVNCGGCTTTVYQTTATEGVDCHGCEKLTTSTTWHPWGGLCPQCVGGVQTVHDHSGTTTVISCSPTPSYAPEGLASKR